MAEPMNAFPTLAGSTGNSSGNGTAWKSLATRWRRLSGDSRSVLVVALLSILVAVAVVVILWTSNRQYVPLYGKQELIDTAAMLQVLEAEGIDFRIDERGGNVLVAKDSVAVARMKLAARGVAAQMPAGIEGLNGLTGLSTSQFMESARYTHAVEGELATTIMTVDGVRQVRVHLALPKRSLFMGREELKPTASVMLDLATPLSEAQVEAIINLVAGSVPGLKADAVAVVDQTGKLLSTGTEDESGSRASARQMDYVSQLERRIAERASDMLVPMLGQDNFRIRVAADVDFAQIEETRETLGDAVLLTESSVLDNSREPLAMGIPGALANEPPIPQENGEENAPGQETANSREEVNRRFGTGRAVTHTRFGNARIESLSVSVLVNDGAAPEPGWTEPQLEKMADIVRTAVGLDPARGDTFTLQSAPFVTAAPAFPELVPAPWWQDLSPWENHIRYALGGLMLLLLIIFGIRPLVKHLVRSPAPAPAAADPVRSGVEDSSPAMAPVAYESAAGTGSGKAPPAAVEDASEATLSLPPPGSELQVQVSHLQLLTEQETDRVVNVLKTWIQDNANATR